ncbi:MAG: thermonuclease family protein [Candidatus Desulfatibia sp.]|uniref:thermonuclease family protein n=1 Tax=Candidatus Desulfatibia sp. TaxID=3101189 RepID=UPI002F2F2DD0
MKKTCLLLYMLFLFFIVMGRLSVAQEEAIVRWVTDGDTIVLADGRHVRYIGINTPEIEHEHQKAEPYGYQAKKYNEKLVFSKTIRLQFDRERHDRFGRLLAYVFLLDGTFINQAMVAQGYAYLLPQKPNIKYAKILLQTQREAMSAQKGMWREMAEEEGGYLGNRRTKRFHTTACPFGKKISLTNRVSFKSKRDAFWAGFAPGKRCLAGKIITD